MIERVGCGELELVHWNPLADARTL
jgi:hypothetical protein